ncbi:MAG: vitamin K epoxide reductase family protein [Anaerolineae bacterium]
MHVLGTRLESAAASIAVAVALALATSPTHVAAQDASGTSTQPAAGATEAPGVQADEASAGAYVPDGRARAVMFYSPSCPHCQEVMHEDLPPLQEIFGDNLVIVFMRTDKDYAHLLYELTNTTFDIARLDQGVPMMVIGDHVMIGGTAIRAEFPALVASYIAQGGIDWPAIPGLLDVIGMQEAMQSLTEQPPGSTGPTEPTAPPAAAAPTEQVWGAPGVGPTPRPATARPANAEATGAVAQSGATTEPPGGTPAEDAEGASTAGGEGDEDTELAAPASGSPPAGSASPEAPESAAATAAAKALLGVQAMPTLPPSAFVPPGELGVRERFMLDPGANAIAVGVLVLMIVVLVAALRPAGWQERISGSGLPGVVVPLLAVAGIVVAAYMAYVETTLNQAYCGPIGDCNAVQQSDYARVFGIPIAWLGLLAYALVLLLWAAARRGSETAADWAWAFLYVTAVAGVAFSVYLTFLEPFVIGATCAWCITSALLMTALLIMTAGHGLQVLRAKPPPRSAAGQD